MGERHSEFDRDADDHYVEPAWCVHRLLDRYLDITELHDPCCGFGTIIDVALERGVVATGSDLVDRASGRFEVKDFLQSKVARPNIVTNPPFRIARKIVLNALSVVPDGGIVAIIAQAKFLFSQERHPLFNHPWMERVIIFSKRPSMPPGKLLAQQGEACRGGGSIDFLWGVWRVGKTHAPCEVEWTL